MKRKYVLIVFILILIQNNVFVACKQRYKNPDFNRGLLEGNKLKGTDSPDGRYALFWIFPYYDCDAATSQSEVVVASTDKTHVYGVIDSSTEAQTVDEFVKTVLVYKWSPDSRYLATHNSTKKDSKLHIYDMMNESHDENWQRDGLNIPDLKTRAQIKMGESNVQIISSGQIPIAWYDSRTLQVNIRLKTQKETKSCEFFLYIQPNNVIDIDDKK